MVKRSGRYRGLVSAGRDPVVWIFLLAGTFEVLSGDTWLHAALLFVVAAVLAGTALAKPAGKPRAGAGTGRAAAPTPSTVGLGAPAPGEGATTGPGARGRGGEGSTTWIRPPLLPGWARSWWFAVAAVAVSAAYVAAVGSLRRYTFPVTAAVGIPALAVLVWAWRVPARPSPDRPLTRRGIALWVAPFVGFGVWELIALLWQPSLTVNSPAHPTFSTLMDPAFSHPAGRMVGLAVWVAIGWFLVRL